MLLYDFLIDTGKQCNINFLNIYKKVKAILSYK